MGLSTSFDPLRGRLMASALLDARVGDRAATGSGGTPRRRATSGGPWVVVALVAMVGAACAGAPSSREGERADLARARALEGRLVAPCCWNQTLDIHDSELAASLRREIRERVRAGESDASIEADLVGRYGERIRAVPSGPDPGRIAPPLIGAAMLLVLVALFAYAWRGARRSRADAPAPAPSRDERGTDYETRLDEELRRLDD